MWPAVKSILFVDDEPNVLFGLRNLLRAKRQQWDMVFACGGEEAIKQLGARPFDVVITDMRMPVIDGAAVLAEVKKRQPRAVRMILSGQTEMESAMKSVLLAHRFLAKPCDSQVLESVLERASRLNDLLEDPELRATAGKVGMLPPAPAVFVALSEVLARPTASAKDVARVVEQDPALCAKVLQLVNSAFFGLPRKISSISESVSYLGMMVIRNLVLAMGTFAGSPDNHKRAALQHHSLLTGQVARLILRGQGAAAEDAFVAGILHDVGHLLTDEGIAQPPMPAARHPLLGAYLLGLWGLPHPIVEAVAFHERPQDLAHPGFELVDVVYLADRLAAELSDKAPAEPLDLTYLASRGVGADKIEGWRKEAAALLAPHQQQPAA
jgi:HD-like signal output (HDOD) protein